MQLGEETRRGFVEGVGMAHINMPYSRQKWRGQNEPPTTSDVFQCLHCGTWPGVWMLFGLGLQLLAPQRYACVGAGLLF